MHHNHTIHEARTTEAPYRGLIGGSLAGELRAFQDAAPVAIIRLAGINAEATAIPELDGSDADSPVGPHLTLADGTPLPPVRAGFLETQARDELATISRDLLVAKEHAGVFVLQLDEQTASAVLGDGRAAPFVELLLSALRLRDASTQLEPVAPDLAELLREAFHALKELPIISMLIPATR